jgi:D-serine deaminase-like pyridoxal phosphate-dependent protein
MDPTATVPKTKPWDDGSPIAERLADFRANDVPGYRAKQAKIEAGIVHVIETVSYRPGDRWVLCTCGWRHDGAETDEEQGTAFNVHRAIHHPRKRQIRRR